jgi:PEGA domain
MAASMMKTIAHFSTGRWSRNFLPEGRLLWRGVELTLLIALSVTCAFAQAAAEYGGATSGVSGSISGINLMNKAKFPTGPKEKPTVIQSKVTGSKGTKFIDDSLIDGSVEANRQALEGHPGKDAGKLMLRSVPAQAYVRINGKIVGRTPLLLVIPPGQYKLAMDGTRMEHVEREVDLLPHETREYSLTLKPLYPTQVEVKLH